MAERIVRKAKEYDRDTIPGDYATLRTPCPNCGGVVKENYRRFGVRVVRIQHHQDPGRAQLRDRRGRGLLAATRRSVRWRASARRPVGRSRPSCVLVYDDDIEELEARVRLRRRGAARAGRRRAGRLQQPDRRSVPCPKCKGRVFEHGASYVCEHAVGPKQTLRLQERQDHPAAADRARADAQAVGRRPHRLARWLRLQPHATQVQGLPALRTQQEGKVVFEFEPRPQRGARGAPAKSAKPDGAAVVGDATPAKAAAKRTPATAAPAEPAAKKAAATKAATKKSAAKKKPAARKSG